MGELAVDRSILRLQRGSETGADHVECVVFHAAGHGLGKLHHTHTDIGPSHCPRLHSISTLPLWFHSGSKVKMTSVEHVTGVVI